MNSDPKNKILIASANPMFAEGIAKMLKSKNDPDTLLISFAKDNRQAIHILDDLQPELIILDHDDKLLQKEEFMERFVESQFTAQIMLVSLNSSGSVVVYDRRTLTAEQASDWLNIPWVNSIKNKKDFSLIGDSMPENNRRKNVKHFLNVAFLVIVFTFVTNFTLKAIGLLPEQASVEATIIDRLFDQHFWIISFLFSLIMVFLVYSFVVFRAKKGDEEDGEFFKTNTRLEIFWTIIPLATVIVFSYIGAISLAETRRVDPQSMNVDVTAGQWYWTFEYPEYGITSDALYLPVNQQVNLSMTSVDVIHSFWVPEFRVKQDVLPGENLVKELRITPTQEGEYMVRCAELCGGAHAYMNSPVFVVSMEEFQTWIDEQLADIPQDPVSKGERLAENNGCIGCHSLDGTDGVGPTWQGAFGSERTLMDGSTVTVNEEYLRTAIVNPNAEIPEGYPPNVMPQNYGDQFTDEEIDQMIAFIKSLD